MKIEINNFDSNPDIQCDLLVDLNIVHVDEAISCTVVTVHTSGLADLTIKFAWKEKRDMEALDFVSVAETNTLFFGTSSQWGAIDVVNRIVKRHEEIFRSPYIYRKDNYMLILDELRAESTRLNGDRIDTVPIDPPTDFEEFDDRIEFTSPVYGKQVLKIK